MVRTDGRTGHHGREGGNVDGNGDGGGDGNEDEYGNELEGRVWAKTGVGVRMEMRVERGDNLGTYGVVIEVGRRTREGGRRQRVTSNHNRKTRRPSETVALCGRSKFRDGRRGTGSGGGEERRKGAKNLEEL